MTLRRTRFVLASIFLAAACGERAEEPRTPTTTLTVSAAASLREALTELEERYERETPGVAVRINFGASGALARQVEQGAPVDVFISAAEGPMNQLAEKNLVDARSRRVLAGNELVLVVPANGGAELGGFADLASEGVKRIALGAPESVPAGQYAEAALTSLGLIGRVKPKAVYGQDVRQVLAYVASGNADAGLVYRTDAAVSGRVRVVASAPAGSHGPITYPVALTSRTENAEAARAFVAYLLGPAGREVLRARGFRVEE